MKIPHLIALLALLTISASASSQQVYAYPNAGQSQEQQSRDRFECHQWSTTQSGFDPSTAAPLPARTAPPPDPRQGYADRPQQRQQQSGGLLGIGNGGFFEGGGMIGDAATGAALGAAGGALAGDAGEGAAIGALASTVFGAFSRSTKPAPAPQPQQYNQGYQQQQQQQSQIDLAYQERAERIGEYNRAFGACMAARDYTIN